MIEQAIEIQTPDGLSEGFLYRDERGKKLPGVIYLTDIGGIRPSKREMAKRVAAEGYTVLMPNVFHRSGRPPMLDAATIATEETRMKRMAELREPLTPEAIERDAGSFVDFLASQDGVGPGPMGVVGYCFTGGFALRLASVRPDRIAAAASFHGGGLVTDSPTSPHFLLPRIRARLYFGHAVQDRSMPEAAIEKLDKALEAWGGVYQSEVYEGANHGWTVTDSPVYNPKQAERAFEKLKELLRVTLH